MLTRSGRIMVPQKSLSRTRKFVSPLWPKKPDKSRKRSKSARLRFRKSSKPPSRKSAINFPTRKSPSRTNKENAQNATSKSPTGHPLIKLEPKVLLYDIKQMPYFIKDLSSSVTQSKIPIESKLNEVDWVNSNHDLLRKKPAVTQRRSKLSDHFGLRDVPYNIPESRSSHSTSARKSKSRSTDGDNITREPSRSHTLITSFKKSIDNVLFSKWYFGKRLGSITLMLLISLTVFAILISCTKLL